MNDPSAFEVDTLEISLREQLDWVDRLFLVEATTTTKGDSKPLLWERLRTTDRFQVKTYRIKVSEVFLLKLPVRCSPGSL